ncbi:hypothetical protein D4764_10G0012020 [Takifugu flavidus]|uniref:Uncharacterized protein n=1 Tax=Takifugu flavidus TaxID=433684 RepID=A0A5C6PJY1_9TELE|nr:hypothetical protein D4764_10G0012020 [Takifugu flavidus]
MAASCLLPGLNSSYSAVTISMGRFGFIILLGDRNETENTITTMIVKNFGAKKCSVVKEQIMQTMEEWADIYVYTHLNGTLGIINLRATTVRIDRLERTRTVSDK